VKEYFLIFLINKNQQTENYSFFHKDLNSFSNSIAHSSKFKNVFST